MLRLPRESFDVVGANAYCHRDGLSLRKKKTCILLDFDSDEEPGERDEWDDSFGWMGTLVQLRGDLLDGDWRCLYLAWLGGIESDGLHEDATEPPVPAGLKNLSAPLRAFVDFLGIDAELLNVAAERSGTRAANEPQTHALEKWIRSLPTSEKESLLLRIAQADEPNPRRILLRSFGKATKGHHATRDDEDATSRRTVAEISDVWDERVRVKQRRLTRQAKKERERQAQVEAQARSKHLDNIASRTDAIWKQVSTWIEKRTPKGYDRATEFLVDLRDAAAQTNDTDEFGEELRTLRDRHAGKPSLICRLEQAGLV